MRQVSKYKVSGLGKEQVQLLQTRDESLLRSYELTSIPFYAEKYRLNLDFYDLNENYVETLEDIRSYKVLGQNKKDNITQISVDPVQDSLDAGYLGDVIVRYTAFNDLFSPDRTLQRLYISEISTDRTEIRTVPVELADNLVKGYVSGIQNKFDAGYFPNINLFFRKDTGNIYCRIINVILEERDRGGFYVTFKLYEPLPENCSLKDIFYVLEQINNPVRFRVDRYVKNIPDPAPTLKGPNFEVAVEQSKAETTEYLTPKELLSYKPTLSGKVKDSIQVSINYDKFEDFIHFSSAAERLQNFRYKFELIQSYKDLKDSSTSSQEKEKYSSLIDGIISNFDHYDRYLYFESGSHAWPKRNSIRPYENETDLVKIAEWWGDAEQNKGIIDEAEAYDDNNENALIASIPHIVREDPNNEAYLIFVHMVGQHFDNEWIYAKALSDRYKGDNRPDFGIASDLVKEAVRGFGLTLTESNQNLRELFDTTLQTRPSKVITSEFGGHLQPLTQDEYTKEVYKRIYHNLPLLIKAKGTQRGLKALINCFGIPENILQVGTLGGINVDRHPYLTPNGIVYNYEDKIRLDNTGSEIEGNVLSQYISTQREDKVLYSDDSHEITVGFDLNKQFNDYVANHSIDSGYFENYLDIDDIIGDPRNFRENYDDAFRKIRNRVLVKARESQVSFRNPVDILLAVRYFDSLLFNSLKEFVPARVSISRGAIVEDNILHRNRYKGVNMSWEEEDYSGSLRTGYVTGSSAGAFDQPGTHPSASILEFPNSYSIDLHEPNTEYFESSSNINGCVSKWVFDQSPKYNGEFKNSKVQVTDGELNDWNKYKHGSYSQTVYSTNFLYLDLPSPAICQIVAKAEKTDRSVYRVNHPESGIISVVNLPETSLTCSNVENSFIVRSGEGGTIETGSHKNYTFLGWCTGSSFNLSSTDQISTRYIQTGSSLSFKTADGKGTEFTPRYSNLPVQSLLFKIDPGGTGGGYGYADNSVLLSWSSSCDIPSILGGNVKIRLETSKDTYDLPSFTLTAPTGLVKLDLSGFSWKQEHPDSWIWGILDFVGYRDREYPYVFINQFLYKPGWFGEYVVWKDKINWHIVWKQSPSGEWQPIWTPGKE